MAQSNGDRDSRLDRMERTLELLIADHEQFRVDLKQLLTAQVLQADQIRQHTEQIDKVSQSIAELRAKDAALDARVDNLVSAIASLIERIPPQSLR